MKRLLLFPLVLVLTSCGYGSLYEARDACQDFYDNHGKNMKGTSFQCVEEDETNQVLATKDYKVIKRFPY